jgi:short-subunit dehydrogenase involved in D-alanine esterification of teichoic acids
LVAETRPLISKQTRENMKLTNNKILITGGASGIGRLSGDSRKQYGNICGRRGSNIKSKEQISVITKISVT